MTTETSTQRPWTEVCQRAKANRIGQFAAMAHAHGQAWDRAVEGSVWWDAAEGLASGDQDLLAAFRRHGAPWAAAFAAAALYAGVPAVLAEGCLDDTGRAAQQIHDWLTAAGIDPAEIAAAL